METLNYMSDGDGRKYLTMKCMTGFWYRRPIRERAGSKPTRVILDWLKLQHIGPNPDFVRKCHTKGILEMLSLYKRYGHILEAVYKRKLRNMVTHKGGIRLELSGISRYVGISMRSVAFYGKKGYDDYVFKHEGYFPS